MVAKGKSERYGKYKNGDLVQGRGERVPDVRLVTNTYVPYSELGIDKMICKVTDGIPSNIDDWEEEGWEPIMDPEEQVRRIEIQHRDRALVLLSQLLAIKDRTRFLMDHVEGHSSLPQEKPTSGVFLVKMSDWPHAIDPEIPPHGSISVRVARADSSMTNEEVQGKLKELYPDGFKIYTADEESVANSRCVGQWMSPLNYEVQQLTEAQAAAFIDWDIEVNLQSEA